MIGGIFGALAAAIPGLVDFISLPAGYTKRVAATHMGINLTIVALYAVNVFMRHGNPENLRVPMIMSLVAIAMLKGTRR